jgi:hypothetical protein
MRGEHALQVVLKPPRSTGVLTVQVSALDSFHGALASRTVQLEVSQRPWWLSWKFWGGRDDVSGYQRVRANPARWP